MMKLKPVLAGLCAVAFSGSASAAIQIGPIYIQRYDLPNGDGTAAGGQFNYWDGTYTGSGSRTVDNAPLTGGLGALTDGVVASQRWDAVSNLGGTGQYVGWNFRKHPTPILQFVISRHADQTYPVVTSVSVAVDNSGVGGVFAPVALEIGISHGYSFYFIPTVTPISANAEWLTVSGLYLPTSFISITPVPDGQPPSSWVFISEVAFTGAYVPETASWVTMLLGLGMIGVAFRRAAARTGSSLPDKNQVASILN